MTDLEGRVNIDVYCTHRPTDERQWDALVTPELVVKAHLCQDCLPQYRRLVEGYVKAQSEEERK